MSETNKNLNKTCRRLGRRKNKSNKIRFGHLSPNNIACAVSFLFVYTTYITRHVSQVSSRLPPLSRSAGQPERAISYTFWSGLAIIHTNGVVHLVFSPPTVCLSVLALLLSSHPLRRWPRPPRPPRRRCTSGTPWPRPPWRSSRAGAATAARPNPAAPPAAAAGKGRCPRPRGSHSRPPLWPLHSRPARPGPASPSSTSWAAATSAAAAARRTRRRRPRSGQTS